MQIEKKLYRIQKRHKAERVALWFMEKQPRDRIALQIFLHCWEYQFMSVEQKIINFAYSTSCDIRAVCMHNVMMRRRCRALDPHHSSGKLNEIEPMKIHWAATWVMKRTHQSSTRPSEPRVIIFSS